MTRSVRPGAGVVGSRANKPTEECSAEREDLETARALLAPHEARARADRERVEAERRALEQRQREERLARDAAIAAALAARQKEEAEAEAKAEAEAAAERARRANARRETYAAMGPKGRALYLRNCFTSGQEVIAQPILDAEGAAAVALPCDVLIARLAAVASSDAEAQALMAALQKHIDSLAPPEPVQQAPAPERAPARGDSGYSGGGSALCCDGSASPTCGCGGGRGCCSHHGGVCGCTD